MSKEGPQNGGMNRREFLKTAAVGTGVATLEISTQAQEQKVLDNSLAQLVYLATEESINYTDAFKPLNPEAGQLILDIQKYQDVFLAGNSISAFSTAAGGKSIGTQPGSLESILEVKKSIWNRLKNLKEIDQIDPSFKSKEYSDELFHQVLVIIVPKYLANYGIVAPPIFSAFIQRDQNKNPVSFFRTGVFLNMFQIDKIERGEIEHGGVKLKRNIIYIKGLLVVSGKTVGDENNMQMAQAMFGNIIVSEKRLQEDYVRASNRMKEVSNLNSKQLLKLEQEALEQNDQLTNAAEIAMIQITGNPNAQFNYESYKQGTITHETRHLIDLSDADFRKARKLKTLMTTTNPVEHETITEGVRIHEEINSILATLSGPHKGAVLFDCLNNLKDDAQLIQQPIYTKAERWIIHKMIEIISQDPEHYGIKVFKSPPSRFNQILNQFNILLNSPDLLTMLCERITALHMQNLGQNIAGEIYNPQNLLDGPMARDFTSIYKIGTPVAILGGAALALEALRRRKKKVVQENVKLTGMTRIERRDYERKKKKKKQK